MIILIVLMVCAIVFNIVVCKSGLKTIGNRHWLVKLLFVILCWSFLVKVENAALYMVMSILNA